MMTKVELEKSFAVFHTNVGKTFMVFASFVLKAHPLHRHSIRRDNFHDSSKILEDCKAFLSHSFCHLLRIS